MTLWGIHIQIFLICYFAVTVNNVENPSFFDFMIMWSFRFSHMHLLSQSGLHPDANSYARPARGRVLQFFATPSSITSQGDAFTRKTDYTSVGTTGVAKLLKGHLLTPLTSTFQNEQLWMPLWILILPRSTPSIQPASRFLRLDK